MGRSKVTDGPDTLNQLDRMSLDLRRQRAHQ
jgi:hypothetical protein